jgi:signal transduction histidine kinase/ActR/RegA family two-component response regulator
VRREILIVEDDLAFSTSLRKSLAADDYLFHEASTVEQSLALLADLPSVRVIILNLSLGQRSGVELLERIQGKREKYKVIVLTSHEEMLVAKRAAEFNVFSYHAKTSRSWVESIRFVVQQAFTELEKEILANVLQKHLRIQEVINGNQSLEDVLDLICVSVLEVVDGHTCHIRLYDFKKGDYFLASFKGRAESEREFFEDRRKIGSSFSGIAAWSKEKILVHDLQRDPRFLKLKDKALKSETMAASTIDYLNRVRSSYIIPISTGIFDTEVDAVLNVSSDIVSYFNHDVCRLIDGFADQATLAIAKNWRDLKRESLTNEYRRVGDMIASVAENLRSSHDLNKIFQIVLQGISKILGAEEVSIFLFNSEQSRLHKVAKLVEGSWTETGTESYQPGESLMGRVFASHQTVRLNAMNRSSDGDYDETRLLNDREVLLSGVPSGLVAHYLAVPMMIGGKTLGVIRSINKKSYYYGDESEKERSTWFLSRGFSDDSQLIMEITASHLAVAIRNSQLISKLNWEIERLSTLTQVARVISSSAGLESDDLLRLIVRKTAEVMKAEFCLLFLKDKNEADRLVLRQTHGIPINRIESVFYGPGEGLTGQVARTGESILTNRADQDHIGKYDNLILDALRDAKKVASIDSSMTVPIIAEGDSLVRDQQIFGVLRVINRTAGSPPFDADDLSMFETFASQIGVALAMAERNSSLSHLVRGVCHEISNTIGLIRPNAALIRHELERSDGGFNKEAVYGRAKLIEEMAGQAADFTQDLLGFSAARFKERENVNINHLLRDLLLQLRDDVGAIKNFGEVRLDLNLSSAPIICAIHRVPFTHMFRNVVINAYQAMEGMGRGILSVTTYLNDSGEIATIEVKDSGVGISEAHLQQVFSPNFSTKEAGNGLGLWLVKIYLEQINGAISVESRLGSGATFRIQIPVLQS